GLELIKNLRAKTRAGVSDCRDALEATGGDLKKAQEWLKAKGLASAGKRAGRGAKAGIVEAYTHADGRVGVVVELNCETDFVARTDEFKALAHELALQIAAMNPKNVEELLTQPYIRDESQTIADLVKETVAKTGENILVRRLTRFALGEQ
ncbi:MAG: translation elongation factor Ts, partial [bacterium]|nr:translation elongation factor Ts [bacterium]